MSKVCLVILDGFGEAPNPDPNPAANAIALAKTPNFDALKKKYPYSLVEACSEAVGLVEGGMGGSEIGHFAIGAGRVVPQTLLQINWSIRDKKFTKIPSLQFAFDNVRKNNSKLHLLGMISDAGVHSHIEHLWSLLEWVKSAHLEKVYLHLIADGRDVRPQSFLTYMSQIKDKIDEMKIAHVVHLGTAVGRNYAMDRDSNWERTQVAYDLLFKGVGEIVSDSLEDRIQEFYSNAEVDAANRTDYHLPALVLDEDAIVEEKDSLIFWNFRTDRPRQLVQAMEDEYFHQFERPFSTKKFILSVFGPYAKSKASIAFPTPEVNNNMGVWLAKKGLKQLRIAETEKFAHVTYFFNSQSHEVNKDEDRVMIESKKVGTFAEAPEMSAREITDALEEKLKENKHDFIALNFANADLVGHTGQLKETVASVEVLDECIGRIEKSCLENNYVLVITGDHGNAEDMQYEDGSPKPSHSMNKVMLLVANWRGGDFESGKLKLIDGGLGDVAPTCLKILGVGSPEEMTGICLIKE
eukprot:maker-scaffold_4-snap-gene-17.52-mRNA-1 protein AED:0.01 eAED:0.01 QI:93/1/1/1/1/1/2/39/523